MQTSTTPVAIVVLKQKKIVAAFREAGATSAATAVRPEAIGVHENMIFRKLKGRAVLREALGGAYFLDELSWEALRRARRQVAFVVILIALVAVIAIVAFSIPTHLSAR